MNDDEMLWLTTEDNPFDFFTQQDRWINYDYQMGYNTCGKIAKASRYSHNLSTAENRRAINDACLDLIRNNGTNFVLSRDGTQVFRYLITSKKVPAGAEEI